MHDALVISIVGAGSEMFSQGSIGDILLSDVLTAGPIDLRLMDIVPKHMAGVTRFAQRAAERLGRRLQVTSTTDLRAAVDGAAFVITAIEVNRYYYWAQDFHIPRKYGFAQIYGENGGPGGMFHALRNMGPLLEIAGAMQELCPDAWLINYSNPEAKLVQAVTMLTKIRTVGMCHGVFMGREQVSKLLGLSEQLLETRACGLNHFAWFQSIRHRETGEDLYPRLREQERRAHWLARWDELALSRLLFRTFGLWPYPGTNHSGEYIRWAGPLMATEGMQYFYDPAAEQPWQTGDVPTFVYDLAGQPTAVPFLGGACPKRIYPPSDRPAPSEEALLPSGEEGIRIMEGIVGGAALDIATVNMPNRGCIPGLPGEMVVELPAVADGNGLHPCQMEPLPAGITAMLHQQGMINRLLVEAFVEGSRRKLLQALLIDPTVSSYHNAVALIDEMCELQSDQLAPLAW